MNLALSDEQEFLREAARGALSRVETVKAARQALEGLQLMGNNDREVDQWV